MSKTDPHPSLRWIVRMPFDRCGAVWRIRVPESPCRYTTVDVYDHQHGGSQELSLIAARSIRDELAADMPLPYPVTSMVRQWRNGELLSNSASRRRRLASAGQPLTNVWT